MSEEGLVGRICEILDPKDGSLYRGTVLSLEGDSACAVQIEGLGIDHGVPISCLFPVKPAVPDFPYKVGDEVHVQLTQWNNSWWPAVLVQKHPKTGDWLATTKDNQKNVRVTLNQLRPSLQ